MSIDVVYKTCSKASLWGSFPGPFCSECIQVLFMHGPPLFSCSLDQSPNSFVFLYPFQFYFNTMLQYICSNVNVMYYMQQIYSNRTISRLFSQLFRQIVFSKSNFSFPTNQMHVKCISILKFYDTFEQWSHLVMGCIKKLLLKSNSNFYLARQ